MSWVVQVSKDLTYSSTGICLDDHEMLKHPILVLVVAKSHVCVIIINENTIMGLVNQNHLYMS